MKILQLGKFYPIKGGVEKVMYDLVLGLSQRMIHCDMLCASEKKTEQEEIIEFNPFSKLFIEPSIIELAKTKISIRLISKLKKIAQRYDIIHIHHPDPMSALALFISGYKGKVILHWHSDILAQKKLLLLYKPLQNWLLKRADLILATSPNYIECSEDLKKYKSKCDVLPIGIEDISLYSDVAALKKIKEKYKNKKIVFSLGRLVNYKGFEYLINAADYLNDDYVILIGGEGPLKSNLQDLINKKNLSSKVELLGYLDDANLYAYYNACDLFCLSSIEKTEAFAIVQIEAMAFGKPVVATRIYGSGVPWVNEDGYSGFNVTPRNSKEIGLTILKTLQNQETYDKYSSNARKRYLENFSINIMIENCVKFYNVLEKSSH
ncbi:glycosyltransferase [Chryseobacterium taiwanense]|uniref:Glycosyl transferase family 1 n=1 Tax=Chryseobacterium taiwanense TaxID=363331 RepID=A0A0B4DGA4_9FLAO|nr:glycosyltransferase [Chryseobacterium taiwanense]KIC63450.1 glycosyl transferase family 1 [Chryseobacterium taiwanense]